jgi:protein-L-isoaspartate(D-aspartate) O-methyltransferase
MESGQAERAQLILNLRSNGISNPDVLSAMERIPRELFIPDTFRKHAYDEAALPIARGQTISQPLIVAMMTQELCLNRRCKVLEIGTGSGYQASVISLLCRRIYTIERQKPLLREAEALFRHLECHNIVTRFGDGTKGWEEQAPFDRIIVTAAAPKIPQPLINQLAEGGRIVIPVGETRQNQMLYSGIKEEGEVTFRNLGAVRFVPLLDGIEAGK